MAEILKEYEVEINGIPHTMLLSEQTARTLKAGEFAAELVETVVDAATTAADAAETKTATTVKTTATK